MRLDARSLRVLIGELRRRRVFRAASVYAVVAFVVIQVADMVFPALHLPGWTVTFVVVLAILGFPVALVLAWAFELTPDGVRRERDAAARPDRAGPVPGARFRGAWLGLAFLVVVVVAWAAIGRSGTERGDAVAADVVAILPFRLHTEPALAYLREGMIDLLAASLTGESGPRAVEPRTMLAAWRRAASSDEADLSPDAAVALARGLGAGRVLLGSVIGSSQQLVLTATVLSVPSGRTGPPLTVEGPVDELPRLVDRLAAQLLAREAGEAPERLAELTSRSLPALRLYLEGQALHRRGRFEDAVDRFSRAVELDTTFALAALRLNRAAVWGFPPRADLTQRGLVLAWASRDRLSRRDRMLFDAIAGPRYPDPSPHAEHLAAWERVVQALPDDAEAWYELGEVLFHYGALIDVDAGDESAVRAWDRALTLDSTFGPARQHAFDMAILAEDTAKLRALGGFEPMREASPGQGALVTAIAALLLRDTASVRIVEARIEARDPLWLRLLVGLGQVFDVAGAPELARRAEPVVAAEARGVGAAPADAVLLHAYYVNTGRPAEAARWTERIARASQDELLPYRRRVLDALCNLGDTEAAAAAADTLRTRLGRTADPVAAAAAHRESCVLGQWSAARGRAAAAIEAVAALRLAADALDDRAAADAARLCADLVETVAAAARGAHDAPARIRRLDAALAEGPQLPELREEANLTLVRLFDAAGDDAAALRASRRREIGPVAAPYQSAALREEARLAESVGQSDAALRAYRHLAALFADPEPGAPAVVADEIRRAIARLTLTDRPLR
jgi:tetratricopeptide (TPR) repeat protein